MRDGLDAALELFEGGRVARLARGLEHELPRRVIDREAQQQPVAACGRTLEILDRAHELRRETVPPADYVDADTVLDATQPLAHEIALHQLHQRRDFSARPQPVVRGERIQREDGDLRGDGGLDDSPHGLRTGAMAGRAGQSPLHGPPPVTVHDDRYVHAMTPVPSLCIVKCKSPAKRLPAARGPDQRFHVIEIALEYPPPFRSQAVLGFRNASRKRLAARDVARFFELASVAAQVPVGRLPELLEHREGHALVHAESAHDAEPDSLVDQPVEILRFPVRDVRADRAQPAQPDFLGTTRRLDSALSHRASAESSRRAPDECLRNPTRAPPSSTTAATQARALRAP